MSRLLKKVHTFTYLTILFEQGIIVTDLKEFANFNCIIYNLIV